MRKVFSAILALGIAASIAAPASALPEAPPSPASLALDAPVTVDTTGRVTIDPALRAVRGRVDVIVRLKDPPLATVVGDGFKQAARSGAARASAEQQRAHLATLSQAQSSFSAQASALGAQELARFSRALNAVAINVDAAQLAAVAGIPGVVSVRAVRNYEMDLSETVPAIGAAPSALPPGVDGGGVVVAVLDSGIDYTHAKLGGAGTLAAYEAAYGTSPADPRNTTRDGLFPTAKVIEGYDFVGEAWPNGPLAPDPDPIDFEGHGTHVADIIAGNGQVRLRAVHASPDAPAVDILVNGAVAFGNVPFKAISDYASLAPGKYNIKIVPAGATTPVVFEADLDIPAGDFTAIATGLLADDGKVDVKVLQDSNAAPADKAKVRFFHGSPDAPAVDIAVANGGPVLFANVTFGNAAPYVEVPGATYDLEVRLAGTNVVVLPLPGVAVENGKTYTAYAVGLVGATPPTLGAIFSVDAAPVTGPGVAPGAGLMAVKVCSAVSSSCSGIALLQGVDYILDPDLDGDLDDAVDVANLSLGSSYGQKEDDLGFALGNAVRFGIVVVASAGNSADRPYIVGSPSSQAEVLSVAQTAVPSDRSYTVIASPALNPPVQAIAQPWAAAPVLTTGPLQFGDGAGGNLLGCDPYPAGSLAGRIVLVDRGTCAISIKVSNVAAGGALAAIVANNASQGPNDPPPTFSFGGGTPNIPGYTVTRNAGTQLKAIVGQTVSIDPASAVNLYGSMVASSSRGPNYSFNAIKPEIGAPGASVSAEAGTGTGTVAFGGTSGAAPMVSGAAALVLDAWPFYSPREVKAVLVNTADTDVFVNKGGPIPTELAPITRIGGGEVRANKAIATSTAAWAASDENPALSFGFRLISKDASFRQRVIVRNFSNQRRTYTITPSFRYSDDAASGAVVPAAPETIVVPPNGTRSFVITLNVIADKLPLWGLNGGSRGGDGWRLQGNEFDGYLTIADGKDTVRLPWQILPHKAANVVPDYTYAILNDQQKQCDIVLTNNGATAGVVEAFALTGTSKRISKDDLPTPGDSFAVIDLRAVGVRQVEDVAQFAVATSGRRAHPNYPAEFDIYIDTNRDGTPDYVVFNFELGLAFASTGQNAVYVQKLGTTTATAFFFADADLNSGTVILTVPLAAIGLTPETQFDFSVYAFDNYFTGALTDAIEDMTHTLSKPRYALAGGDQVVVPAGGTSTITVVPGAGTAADSPSQTGILLLYRDAAGREWQAIPVRNK